jgi:F420-non-reducing hydrogenase small subunit
MKAKVSTECLGGCSGCQVAIVDLHRKLLTLAGEVEFVRIPDLMDENEYPAADVGIVAGAVRSEDDREALLRLRDSVKTLMAFGTCAAFGGPSGMGRLHPAAEAVARVYGADRTSTPGDPAGATVPAAEESAVPIDEVVKVDFYLPGCPPSPYFVAAALKALLGGNAAEPEGQGDCGANSRKMQERPAAARQAGAALAADAMTCFV